MKLGQDAKVHPVPLRRHRERAAPVGYRNTGGQKRTTGDNLK